MKTKRNDVYKCNHCGTMMQVLHEGNIPVCCGTVMERLEPNTQDASQEKHVPFIEKIDGGYKVTVGSVEHPMEEAHYIEWIQLIAGESVHTVFLHPGEKPSATFTISTNEPITTLEYCNLHGLWKASL
ncbi:MAG: desulfoferrodoxin [Desulfovibrionaceae bacterium]|nr:desulfoferrodoxin [Desulfovibrionaceae bacterium]